MKIRHPSLRHILTAIFVATMLMVCTLPAYAGFKDGYSLSGSSADKMVSIARAQLGRTQGQMGYENPWCAYFVSDTAKIAGEAAAVPYNGGCRELYNAVIKAGGKAVSTPQKGDLVFFVCRKCKVKGHDDAYCHVGIVTDSKNYISGNVGKLGDSSIRVVDERGVKTYSDGEHSVSSGVISLKYARPAYKNASSASNNQPSTTPSSSVSVKTDGYYTIKNLGSGKMLNVYGSKAADKTNVTVYHEDQTSGQDFKFISNGSGGYVLEPRCATKSALNVYGDSSQSNSNVTIWRKTGNPTQSWIIDYNSSQKGYVIRSADNTSYVLTAKGKDDSSDVRLAPYDSSSKYQIWTSAAFPDGSSNNSTPSSTNNITINVAKDVWEVSVGDQVKINFTFTGEVSSVTYGNEDSDKFKLTEGGWSPKNHNGYIMVKMLKEGTCNIPIFLYDKGGKLADFHQVSIYAKKSASSSQEPTTLTFSPSSLSLDLSNKKNQEITVTVGGNLPKGCYLDSSMSNPSIATVDWSRCEPGTVFHPTITAKAAGETTFTCSVKSGDSVLATANLKITVATPAAPSTYTVKYDANGGKNAPASQTKTAQRALTLDRAQPARDGYTFAGWATSKDGSAQYQPGGQYTEDKDVTLYAVWKKTENKVSLTLAKTSFDIKAGDQAAIDFTFDGTVDSISYQIDDESICKYVDGEWKYSQHKGTLTVKAMTSGTTSVTIVLYDENDNVLASRTATITVSGRTPSVEEDPVTMTLYPYIDEVVPGSKVRLNFAFTGEVEGMFFDIADRSVFTDRGGELDFNQHTGYYEFEALSPGTTDITIILYEGEGASYKVLASETVSVTVKKSVAFYPSNPTPDYDPITVLSLDRTAMTLIAGGGYVEIHATSLLGNPVTWDTSESGIILLSYDDGSSAAITPIAPGTVTVTARTILNGKEYEANCVVTVMPEMSVSRIPGNDTIYTAPMGQ